MHLKVTQLLIGVRHMVKPVRSCVTFCVTRSNLKNIPIKQCCDKACSTVLSTTLKQGFFENG